MALESVVLVGLMKLAVVAVAGFCGLRMCRAMLPSKTDSDLRREAAISMLRPGNSYGLSSCQQAAVLRDLCACAPPPEAWKTQVAHLAGYRTSRG